jgi:hypothetical protein
MRKRGPFAIGVQLGRRPHGDFPATASLPPCRQLSHALAPVLRLSEAPRAPGSPYLLCAHDLGASVPNCPRHLGALRGRPGPESAPPSPAPPQQHPLLCLGLLRLPRHLVLSGPTPTRLFGPAEERGALVRRGNWVSVPRWHPLPLLSPLALLPPHARSDRPCRRRRRPSPRHRHRRRLHLSSALGVRRPSLQRNLQRGRILSHRPDYPLHQRIPPRPRPL